MSITTGKLGIIRLDGDDLARLRIGRFTLDKFRCTNCGRRVVMNAPEWSPIRAHLAHVIARGAGGSDTTENTRTKCGECHFRYEHRPKVVRSKD